MANAFHLQPLGNEGSQAVQFAVDHIIAVSRGRTDSHVNMAAHQRIDGLLAAVVGNRLSGDVQ